MRASIVVSTLALTAAVLAAPAPRPIQAGVNVDSDKAQAEAKSAVADVKKAGHGAGQKVPATVSVSGRQADLPTSEITTILGKVTADVPVDTVKDSLPLGLPLPVKRQLDQVTGVVGSVTGALPLETVEDALPVDLPLPVKRQLSTVTGLIGTAENALPVGTVKDALPVDLPVPVQKRQVDAVTGLVGTVTNALPVDTVTDAVPVDLPLPVRRGELGSLSAPATGTLNLLVAKFTAATSSLSSAASKLNAMLPANIKNADAGLDQVITLLSTAQSEFNSAIDAVQGGNISGLLTKATAAGSSKTAQQLVALMATGEKMLTQLAKDADTMAGLGVTTYLAKLESIKSTSVTMLAQLKQASALPVPL